MIGMPLYITESTLLAASVVKVLHDQLLLFLTDCGDAIECNCFNVFLMLAVKLKSFMHKYTKTIFFH